MGVIIANSEGWPGLDTAVREYKDGSSAVDIVEKAIREVESEPEVHSVGLGSWPNAAGELELDACIVEGAGRRTGAVGALKGYLHPISVAKSVMNNLSHVFLAGDGAARYAAEISAEQAELLTDEARERYNGWLDLNVPGDVRGSWPNVPMAEYAARSLDPEKPEIVDEKLGTTVYLALRDNGTMAAGVSTSGWAWKYPGRLGDSPIAGAGCYADDRYGAAACTGMGELAIRACASYAVVSAMGLGLSVREACIKTAAEVLLLEPPAGAVLTIHALSNEGEHHVLRVGSKAGTEYYLWQDRMRKFSQRKSAVYRA